MSAPIEVPAMAAGFIAISSSASMIAIWASPRAPPPPSASAKLLVRAAVTRLRLAGECPCPGGERTHHFGSRRRVGAGRGAVAHAADDALQDRGDAEEIIGRVDRHMRPRVEAGARHI